jgi:hypothetical protein
MLGHSKVFQHFMETEGSIPNSQELSTCSYPEPDQSSPHHSIPPLLDSKLVLVLTILTFLREVPVSNLGCDTVYAICFHSFHQSLEVYVGIVP